MHYHSLKTISVLIIVMVGLNLLSCADPDGPVGSKVGSDIGGEPVTSVSYADMDSSLVLPPAQTGDSQHLYVGSAYGVKASTLIKFYRPERPFEWTVDTAYIELVRQGGIGEGDMVIGVRQLDFIWTESDTIDADSIPFGMAFSFIGQGDEGQVWRVPGVPTVRWITEWLNWVDSSGIDPNWIDTTRADSGLTIFLVPFRFFGDDLEDDVDRLDRFHSRSAIEDTMTGNLKPRLFIAITARDSADGELYHDTLEVIASDDMFLLEYDTEVGVDDLTIGSGAVYRSFIHFDLSAFDTVNYDMVVNRAVLVLHRKPLAEPWSETPALWPFRLAGDVVTDLRNAEARNLLYVQQGTLIEESDNIQVTDAVSKWVTGIHPNYWLGLRSLDEGGDIDRAEFYSSSAVDSLRPKLTVYYTRFPK